MTLAALGDAEYIALETFRQNGTGVVTPVWVAGENGKLYVWTMAESWKVKRIRRNGRVRVAPSDVRGNPEGEWLDAHASIAETPAEVKATEKRLAKKYGIKFHLFAFMIRLRRTVHTAIEISVVPES